MAGAPTTLTGLHRKHSFFHNIWVSATLFFCSSSYACYTVRVHNGHTINICQPTDSYNRLGSVCTHSLTAKASHTWKTPSFMFCSRKTCSGPQWPCICALPSICAFFLKTFHPDLSFKSHLKYHLLQDGHPALPPSAPPPQALCASACTECVFSDLWWQYYSLIYLTLCFPLTRENFESKNSAFPISVFSLLVFGTRSVLNKCLLSEWINEWMTLVLQMPFLILSSPQMVNRLKVNT